MKRFGCVFLALFTALLVFTACEKTGNDDSANNEGLQNSVINTELSECSEESVAVPRSWDSFVEYTVDLPAPDFILDSPLEVYVDGELILTFSAEKGTTIDELKLYLSELEKSGFVNSVDTEKADYYAGIVYRGNMPALEYTYRQGLVFIDVFLIKDGSVSVDEESLQIEQGSVCYEK